MELNWVFYQRCSDVLLQQIFRPPLEAYDVLIHLLPKLNSRWYEAVDLTCEKQNRRLKGYRREPGEKIPITGFNPVDCFVAELRVSTLRP
jgi:U3 small nucleolar RNA-associated protein 22